MLPKQERFILYAAGAGVALLLIFLIVISPLLDWREELATKIKLAQADVESANRLTQDINRNRDRWNKMTTSVLPKQTDEAEAMLFRNVDDWAKIAGLNVSATTPERVDIKPFQKVILRTTASGSMVNVSRFIWKLKTATLPIRIEEFSIEAKKDGVDDVKITAGISTVRLLEEKKPGVVNKPAPTAVEPQPEAAQ